MSCYFRQLKDLLDEAGIEVTPGNREQIDQIVHQLVGVTYKDCPQTWKAIKQNILGDDERQREFLSRLKAAL